MPFFMLHKTQNTKHKNTKTQKHRTQKHRTQKHKNTEHKNTEHKNTEHKNTEHRTHKMNQTEYFLWDYLRTFSGGSREWGSNRIFFVGLFENFFEGFS